jgi:hypothetical protein
MTAEREQEQRDGGPDYPPADREEMLALLDGGVREAHRKVESGRVRDPEKEKVRIKWVRALAYAANSYRQLLRDEQLDDMEGRLADLEDREQGEGVGAADDAALEVFGE